MYKSIAITTIPSYPHPLTPSHKSGIFTFKKCFNNKHLNKIFYKFSTYPQMTMCNLVDNPNFLWNHTNDVNNLSVIKSLYTSYTHIIHSCNTLISKTISCFVFNLYSYTHFLLTLLLIYKKRN